MEIQTLLKMATKEITANYFQFPIASHKKPIAIYRERVYCYELYHQLRLIWPINSPFELSGEVDKSGHPLIRGNNLDNTKPDFLIHTPGDMNGNHTVIEVKPITAGERGIRKDLATLTAYCKDAGYKRAIYLFYGYPPRKEISTLIDQFKDQPGINLDLIEVWHHEAVGSSAKLILKDKMNG